MVDLKNIKKVNNSISADYYPEGKISEKGFMSISLQNGKILEHRKVGCMAAGHVLYELRRLATLSNPPSETTVLWY